MLVIIFETTLKFISTFEIVSLIARYLSVISPASEIGASKS